MAASKLLPMKRDLRDPSRLGQRLITLRGIYHNEMPLSVLIEFGGIEERFLRVPDYDSNPSTLEKYGRPQDLPSTLPN